jgi:uncharacterized protein YacL
MSIDLIARLVGMVVFGVLGYLAGAATAIWLRQPADRVEVFAWVFMLVGLLVGLILTPYLSTRPVRAVRGYLGQLPAGQLMAGAIGLLAGLLAATLVAFPLSFLPDPFNRLLPSIGALVFGYFGIAIMSMRYRDLYSLFNQHMPSVLTRDGGAAGDLDERVVLLDTSVIIDGRIADISLTGFVQSTMLVPRVVLNELQHIADSSDMLRRNRGRRGLEVLNRLQRDTRHPLRITDMDVEEVRDVDDKLVLLAKRLRCPILTNDYNLNRVAELQGVRVLNINELANAVKAVFLPGESMVVHIIQEGKEPGQGVGYLDDGTMVVVEEGRRYIDRRVDVMVTKVLQTAAGRMIFARPEDLR